MTDALGSSRVHTLTIFYFYGCNFRREGEGWCADRRVLAALFLLLTGGPAKPAGPGGPVSPLSP